MKTHYFSLSHIWLRHHLEIFKMDSKHPKAINVESEEPQASIKSVI